MQLSNSEMKIPLCAGPYRLGTTSGYYANQQSESVTAKTIDFRRRLKIPGSGIVFPPSWSQITQGKGWPPNLIGTSH
jgi:hypothetical protein